MLKWVLIQRKDARRKERSTLKNINIYSKKALLYIMMTTSHLVRFFHIVPICHYDHLSVFISYFLIFLAKTSNFS